MYRVNQSSRRQFLLSAASSAAAFATRRVVGATQPDPAASRKGAKAQIAITLDLEMSAGYPRPGMTEWNYEKGNLDDDTKGYALEAARIVAKHGGVIHFF